MKTFFGLGKPGLHYATPPPRLAGPEVVPAGTSVTLLHPGPSKRRTPAALKTGDTVKTGQRLSLYGGADYVIAPVTGTVTALAPFAGHFGRDETAITITASSIKARDDQFASARREPSPETLRHFLAAAPGLPPLERLCNPKRPVKTLVVCGVDEDLLVFTQQHVLRARSHEITSGIQVLKQATGIEDVVILTLREAVQGHGHIDGRVMAVDPVYPSAHPHLVMHQVFGREVPAGQTPEDLGFCFMCAEAVAAIGVAFETGRIPVTKVLTLVARDGTARLVETPIGTRVGDIFERFGIAVVAGDRVVLGGPMRGAAAYSLDQPVRPGTDAVMVLDAASASSVSDYPCVNCGDCVRVCPARMQINLLVRYLEAGKYEDGAESYDLDSCVGCGLCAYVCVSKIPILQYITLAKHELARVRPMEDANA
ncbi:MAG: 4Fe-4S dicluster domain-containing protein [Deltaproteobacteria bacterium]|nr:4Fe-4S dicluster domain-containing protein [Deltaproteobacteria bacterium]